MHKNKVYIIYRHTHTTFTLANKYGVKLMNLQFQIWQKHMQNTLAWIKGINSTLVWFFITKIQAGSSRFFKFSGVPNDWLGLIGSYSTPFHAQLVRERKNAVNTTVHLRCWFLTNVPREEKCSTDKCDPTNIATIHQIASVRSPFIQKDSPSCLL